MNEHARWPGWTLIVLASTLGGWLVFDGTRAFVIGDYVTPGSGDYAGRLGPWADLVSAAGINPRSTLVKAAHVLLGLAWCVAAVGVIRRAHWSRAALLTCAAASLWYLPVGTVVALAAVILLQVPALRTAGAWWTRGV